MIYLIDKINQLEQYTIENLHVDKSRIPEPTKMPLPSSAKNALIGLAGKNLWDAMCGKGGEGISPADMESARKRYEVVLHKHIEMIFEDGKSDAAAAGRKKQLGTQLTFQPYEEWSTHGFRLNMHQESIK